MEIPSFVTIVHYLTSWHGFLAVIVVFLTSYITWESVVYNKWKNISVVHITPIFPFGSFFTYFVCKSDLCSTMIKYYNEGASLPYIGFYIGFRPAILIRDPLLATRMFKSNFDHFCDRVGRVHELELASPLLHNIFSASKYTWNRMRNEIDMAFSANNLKMISEPVYDCIYRLNVHLNENCMNSDNNKMAIHSIIERYVCNVIASIAFGIDINALKQKEQFFELGKQWQTETFRDVLIFGRKYGLPESIQKYFGWIKQIDGKTEDFFFSTINNVVFHREVHRACQTKDFMQLMLCLRNNGNIRDKDHFKFRWNSGQPIKALSTISLAEHVAMVFSCGFNTISATITFFLYEMAKNATIQDRLHQNLLAKMVGSTIPYEDIMTNNYLENCLLETLRKYPADPVLIRSCSKKFVLPESTKAIINERTTVCVSVLGIHHDPQFFPNPLDFNPNRFNQRVPGHCYFPFGIGRRSCTGMFLSKMIMKCTLVNLLTNYKFKLDSFSTPEIDFQKKSFLKQCDNIHLQVFRRI